jgi:hypothetical protein
MAVDYFPTSDPADPPGGAQWRRVGAPTTWQCLDASRASWAELWASSEFGPGPSANWDASLVGIIPTGKVGWCLAQVAQQRAVDAPAAARARARLTSPAVGTILEWSGDSALNAWQYMPSANFFATSDGGGYAGNGSVPLTTPVMACYVDNAGSADASKSFWRFNEAVIRVVSIYDAPVAVVSAPSGSFVATRVTATWATTPTPGFAQDYYEVRVFDSVTAASPGFDPNLTAATYRSGERPGTAQSFAIPFDFAPGSYFAFVRATTYLNFGSGSYQQVMHRSAWAKGPSFTMVSASPPALPPTIPTNMVTSLSTANAAALAAPHRPTFQAVLYWWDGSSSWPLNVVSGSVTADARAKVRRTCSLEVANIELVPPSAAPVSFSFPLHPFGSYISLSRGINDELVNLGTFRIESVSWDRSGSGATPVKIDGRDWSANVDDARFTVAQTRQNWVGGSPSPMLVSDVALAIIAEAQCASLVTATTDSVVSNYTNDRTTSRMDALRSLADSEGWQAYADVTGRIVFAPIPDSAAATVRAALIEGVNAIILSQSSTLSRDQVFDVVVAANDQLTFVGSAYDTAAGSPIARAASDTTAPAKGAGAFVPAMKPFFFASPVLGSVAAAQASAATLLKSRAIPSDRMVVDVVPIPDLRPYDVVTVRRFNSPSTDAPVRYYVEAATIPLDVSSKSRLTLVGPPVYVVPGAGV